MAKIKQVIIKGRDNLVIANYPLSSYDFIDIDKKTGIITIKKYT